jgi:protein-tyrosine phosphatase
VIDLHSHVLPGVDDGVESLDAALELARSAVADGVTVLAATPHVREDYPTAPARMEALVGELRAALAEHDVPLDLRPGGEIALDRLALLDHDDLQRFGLGGNEALLLLEFPYYGWPLALEQQIFDLRARGFDVVLAHPERNREVQARPESLRRAVEIGAFVQLTAASVDGRLGRTSRGAAFELLELELAHLIASDAHAPGVRQVGMAAAAEAVADEALAHWLTSEVPQALIDGTHLPPRPERQQRKRRRWRL